MEDQRKESKRLAGTIPSAAARTQHPFTKLYQGAKGAVDTVGTALHLHSKKKKQEENAPENSSTHNSTDSAAAAAAAAAAPTVALLAPDVTLQSMQVILRKTLPDMDLPTFYETCWGESSTVYREWIEEQGDKEDILLSDWDFGHHLNPWDQKAYGQKRTITYQYSRDPERRLSK